MLTVNLKFYYESGYVYYTKKLENKYFLDNTGLNLRLNF